MRKISGATGLGLVDFEMPVRYPRGGDKWAEGCICLKFRSKGMAVDINVGVINIYMLFKVMRLSSVTKAEKEMTPTDPWATSPLGGQREEKKPHYH